MRSAAQEKHSALAVKIRYRDFGCAGRTAKSTIECRSAAMCSYLGMQRGIPDYQGLPVSRAKASMTPDPDPLQRLAQLG